MKKTSEFTKGMIGGTLSLTVATLMVKLLGLIYKIPLSYILGDSGMGYFNSAYTIYSLFYIISVSGVPKAITLLVTEGRTRGLNREAENTYKVAVKTFTYVGIIISVILFVFSAPLAKLIGNINSAESLMLIAPSIIFTSVCGVMRGYLCADMKFYRVASSQVIDALGKTMFGIALALMGFKLNLPEKYISALTILGASLGAFLSFVYLKITIKKDKTREKAGQIREPLCAPVSSIKRILKIALPLTVGAVAINLTNIVDLALIMKRLIVAGYTQEQANALYGNYTTMVTPMLALAGAFISPITVSAMPELARAYTKGDLEVYNKKFELSLMLVSFLIIPVFFGFTFFAPEVLMLIFDDSGAAIAAPLLALSGSTVVFMAFNLLTTMALEACGYVKAPIYTTLAATFIKIIAGYFMIGDPRFGISGAAIGTVIFYVLAFLIGGIILLKKCKIKIPLLKCFMLPFLNSVLMVFITKSIIKTLFGEDISALKSICSILCCMFIYAFFAVLFYIIGAGRLKIRQNARKLQKKII